MKRNDLVYEVLPPRWLFGLPVGNGEVGGMVWVEDGSKLIITLDNVWAWDERHHPIPEPNLLNFRSVSDLLMKDDMGRLLDDVIHFHRPYNMPTKAYVGRLVVDFDQKISGRARLALETAEVEIELKTESGETVPVNVVAFAGLPVIMVEHPNKAPIKDIRLERVPPELLTGSGRHPRKPENAVIPDWYKIPPYETGKTGDVRWICQSIPQSPSLALALLVGKDRSFVTVQVAHDRSNPVAGAVTLMQQASRDAARLYDDHQNRWRNFWNRSSVQLPDAQIESLWYMGLYLLSACNREGGAAVGLHGLWPPDGRMPPQHGFYIWDFYPEYWGAFTANHLELGDVYYDYFVSLIPKLREGTRKFYGWDGIFVPGFMSVDGSWIVIDSRVLLWPGTSAWVAQLFWWRYLYSKDQEFLRHKAYPFMRECMLFYENRLGKTEGGEYHVYTTNSPEWGDSRTAAIWQQDDTLTLSLLRYLVRAMLEAVTTLRIDEPHEALWHDILEHLPDYPQDSSGLCLMPGLRLSHSHRHMSHLAPIFPGGELTVEGSPLEVQLINRSLENLVAKGCWEWQGWSFVWASCISSRAGRAQMAAWLLRQFADAFVSSNTFNLNGDWRHKGICENTDTFSYCQDGNMAAVAAVNEMLLQTWGGCIRVFPTCPSDWREVKFDRLLAEGGVEVSAVRSKGRTLGVKLESKAATRVRLRNPFGEMGGYVGGRLMRSDEKGDLDLELEAGRPLWVTAEKGTDLKTLENFEVKRNAAELNPYGLKFVHPELFSKEMDDLEINHKVVPKQM